MWGESYIAEASEVYADTHVKQGSIQLSKYRNLNTMWPDAFIHYSQRLWYMNVDTGAQQEVWRAVWKDVLESH